MHGQVSSVLMVLGLLQANALEAKEPVFELRPSSPWNVNWADNYCVLQRMFGKADEGVLLRFMSFTPDPFYQIQLTGELADMNRPRREISFAFTPFASDDDVAMAATVKGLDKSYPSLMFGTRIASDTEELSRMSRQAQDRAHEGGKEGRASNERPIASEVQALNIDLGARKLTFETGSLDKPFTALRQCSNDLLKQWGVDAELQRQVVTKAAISGTKNLVHKLYADFVEQLAREGAQGRVNVVVTLDAKGTPESCRVPISQNDKRLDAIVCEQMMKLHFEPARRADDTAVASYYSTTVIFGIG